MPSPYGSHVEFLTRLGGGGGDIIRRVLDLGSGPYSTPLFLDKTIFQHVTYVLSLEHLQVWADRVQTACGGDTAT